MLSMVQHASAVPHSFHFSFQNKTLFSNSILFQIAFWQKKSTLSKKKSSCLQWRILCNLTVKLTCILLFIVENLLVFFLLVTAKSKNFLILCGSVAKSFKYTDLASPIRLILFFHNFHSLSSTIFWFVKKISNIIPFKSSNISPFLTSFIRLVKDSIQIIAVWSSNKRKKKLYLK